MNTRRNYIPLWKDSFDNTKWKNKQKIKELLSQIEVMEGIVKKYLRKTEKDFPNLTDHSIDHSYMLWEYANIIVGTKKYFLNPLEAFILNSVFLLHDAGMCYSVLSNKEDIKKDSFYTDYVSNNKNLISKEELEDEALFFTIRQNHGDYAIRIAIELLNNEEYLISDVEYRQEFGEMIGKISKSHTCNINYIDREFGNLYSSPKFPVDWTIDIKKIAFLLRTSDAAHIDNLRTPKTLKMIAEITGESRQHWTFQKKLGFPSMEIDGYLVYSTNSAFKKDEQKAWWFCFDALKTLDTELKNAENYFVTSKQNAFDAKGVKYINDTIALGRYSIKTAGWDSINTSIRVSNPVHIASELGGVKLYENKNIAIRELIQNSIDAIHLYRLHTGQNSLLVGRINIELEKNNDEYFLSITDNGIGMSQSLLTNELLDFGGSYWKSDKFYSDFKGMLSRGFESIGKFGIGFFSVFMLSKKITVTSWKYGEGIEAMRTLDFYDGINTNPILRNPSEKECEKIIDRGTSIRLKLERDPYKKGGIVFEENFKEQSLKTLVQFYVPSVDVEILIKDIDGSVNYLAPNSIESLNYLELIQYVHVKQTPFRSERDVIYSFTDNTENFKKIPIELIEIRDKDKLFGKLSLLPDSNFKGIYFGDGTGLSVIVMSKGIRIKSLGGMIGYINSDDVISIKRDAAVNVISYKLMKDWAIKQLSMIKEKKIEKLYKERIKDIQAAFELHDDSFEILQTKRNGVYKFITIREFRNYVKSRNKISIFEEKSGNKRLPKTCDGLINKIYGFFVVRDIIKETDIDKVKNSEKIIKQIVKELWGDYDLRQENNMFDFESKKPYSSIWTFTRKGFQNK